jgi:hypothetical protein
MRWQSLVNGSVDTLPVVLLQAGEVAVGDRDHLLSWQTLRRRDRPEPDVFGLATLVHALDVVRSPASRLEVHGLDLRDSTELDPEAQAHEDRRIRLAHRPHHCDLSELGVGKDVFVVAGAAGRLPEAVTNLEHLVVLAVLDVLGQRQLRGIVGDHGGQVLIDDALEARAIAVERDRSG